MAKPVNLKSEKKAQREARELVECRVALTRHRQTLDELARLMIQMDLRLAKAGETLGRMIRLARKLDEASKGEKG